MPSDTPTLQLLRHLSRRPNSSSVLIVGAYRDAEVERAQTHASLFADLIRTRAHAFRCAASPRPRSRNSSNSVSEPISEARRRRSSNRCGSRPAGTRSSSTRCSVICTRRAPASELASGRCARRGPERDLTALDPAQRRAAPCSWRRRCTVTSGTSTRSPSSHPGARRRARRPRRSSCRARITPAGSANEPRYSFVHALVREAVYTAVSAPRRQRLHLRIAQLLGAAPSKASNPTRLRSPCTTRSRATSPTPTGRSRGSYAGEDAQGVFAFEDGVTGRQPSDDLQATATRRPILELAGLLERLAAIIFASGSDPDHGVAAVEEALAIYEQRGDTERAAAPFPARRCSPRVAVRWMYRRRSNFAALTLGSPRSSRCLLRRQPCERIDAHASSRRSCRRLRASRGHRELHADRVLLVERKAAPRMVAVGSRTSRPCEMPTQRPSRRTIPMIFLTTISGTAGAAARPQGSTRLVHARSEQSEAVQAPGSVRTLRHGAGCRLDLGQLDEFRSVIAEWRRSGFEPTNPPRYRGLGPCLLRVARDWRRRPRWEIDGAVRGRRRVQQPCSTPPIPRRRRRPRPSWRGRSKAGRGRSSSRVGVGPQNSISSTACRPPRNDTSTSVGRARRGLAQRPGAPITPRPCSVPSRDETRRPRISPPAATSSTRVRGSCGGACSSISSASNSVTRARWPTRPWRTSERLGHGSRAWRPVPASRRKRAATRHRSRRRAGQDRSRTLGEELTASDAGRPGR